MFDSHDENDDVDDGRTRLTDFEIVSRIGSGSFGTVFRGNLSACFYFSGNLINIESILVRRVEDGHTYVIKNVRISELSKKEQYEAINEVDILAKMDSPFVVRYFDSFIDRNCLHIVMEFCNKGDLQKMIKRAEKKELKSLGEKSTWNIILQVL
jgi:NIMA (never in mitosis gene a)-related kinase